MTESTAEPASATGSLNLGFSRVMLTPKYLVLYVLSGRVVASNSGSVYFVTYVISNHGFFLMALGHIFFWWVIVTAK